MPLKEIKCPKCGCECFSVGIRYNQVFYYGFKNGAVRSKERIQCNEELEMLEVLCERCDAEIELTAQERAEVMRRIE